MLVAWQDYVRAQSERHSAEDLGGIGGRSPVQANRRPDASVEAEIDVLASTIPADPQASVLHLRKLVAVQRAAWTEITADGVPGSVIRFRRRAQRKARRSAACPTRCAVGSPSGTDEHLPVRFDHHQWHPHRRHSELLDRVEAAEMRSLEWGYTEGSLSEDETLDQGAIAASPGDDGRRTDRREAPVGIRPRAARSGFSSRFAEDDAAARRLPSVVSEQAVAERTALGRRFPCRPPSAPLSAAGTVPAENRTERATIRLPPRR